MLNQMIEKCIVNEEGKDIQFNVMHFHETSYEIIFVTSGEGTIVINNNIFPLVPNSIYLIDGIFQHCSTPGDQVEYRRSKIFFNKANLSALFEVSGIKPILDELFPSKGRMVTLHYSQVNEVNSIIDMLNSETNSDPLLGYSILYELFTIINNGRAKPTKYIDDDIYRIFNFIRDNISNFLSIELIADAMHMNKYYLCHKFKLYTNMTVGKYIRNCRISLARQMLLETNKTVSQISYDVGFDNFSHFSRVFHEVMGTSPLRYRHKFNIHVAEDYAKEEKENEAADPDIDTGIDNDMEDVDLDAETDASADNENDVEILNRYKINNNIVNIYDSVKNDIK